MPALQPQWRRVTAERPILRKRNPLPQDQVPPAQPLNNAFSLPGPITLTVNRPPTATLPPQQPPSSPPLPPSPSSTSQTLVPPSPTTLPPPFPSITTIPDTDPDLPPPRAPTVSSDLSTGGSIKTIPPGAIVGIVIAGVLLLLTVVVLLVRRSFKQNRIQRRATWLNNGGISNQTVMANAPAGQSASTFAPAERYPTPNGGQYGTSSLPGAGAASMALAAVAVADPGGGDVSPGYAFASAQAAALSSGAIAISSPPATYNNPAVSPKTIPSVISAGDTATVKFTFIPSLPDELSISNGEAVKVLQEYDDGWALCVNSRDVQGMVPLECLERGAEKQERPTTGYGGVVSMYGASGDVRNSKRASSLNVIQATGSRRQ